MGSFQSLLLASRFTPAVHHKGAQHTPLSTFRSHRVPGSVTGAHNLPATHRPTDPAYLAALLGALRPQSRAPWRPSRVQPGLPRRVTGTEGYSGASLAKPTGVYD